MLDTKRKQRKDSLFEVAMTYSSPGVRWLWLALIITALLCASCNVALPLIEREILNLVSSSGDASGAIGLTQSEYLAAFLVVTIVSYVLLAIENVFNLKILYMFRRALEQQILRNLATHKSADIAERGAGTFSSSITGDANQVASMVAANYFAMFINLISAIVSIVISATWYLPFMVIALSSYAAIIIIVFVFNEIEVHHYKKGQDLSYSISPKIVELLETHDAILNNVNYLQYINSLMPVYKARDKRQMAADVAVKVRSTLIKMIQGVALAVFLIYAVADIADGSLSYATFTALISYMATIFLPVDSLAEAWTSRNKFHAFYQSLKEYLSNVTTGILPLDDKLYIKHISLAGDDGADFLNGLDVKVESNIGIVGLSGPKWKSFADTLIGDKRPSNGQILIGDGESYKIRKSLVMSLIRYSTNASDCFDGGLEYNITLGKLLLSDSDYAKTEGEYLEKLNDFLYSAKTGEMFLKKNRKMTRMFLGDLLSMDVADYRLEQNQKPIINAFNAIRDFDAFVYSVGPAIFAQKYAKRSRYEKIVNELGLSYLKDKDFGARGVNLSESEGQLLMLGRFLLSDVNVPYVLRDPTAYLDPVSKAKALECLRKNLRNAPTQKRGLIFSDDLNDIRYLAEKIIVIDENGEVEATGDHYDLLNRSQSYQKLWKEATKHASKATIGKVK